MDSTATSIWNVLELPVTQVPLGLSCEGLPLGVQVVAGNGNDHLSIAVALFLEQKFGGWTPPRPDLQENYALDAFPDSRKLGGKLDSEHEFCLEHLMEVRAGNSEGVAGVDAQGLRLVVRATATMLADFRPEARVVSDGVVRFVKEEDHDCTRTVTVKHDDWGKLTVDITRDGHVGCVTILKLLDLNCSAGADKGQG
jgi:hypothetical protein